jgi:mannose-6-phosphate isomerase
VIDAEPGAEIVYGHHAVTPEEFREKVESGQWDVLLRKVKVKPGDFFYVPSGTIHAIGGGTLILETQQNSDITYRVYDYVRKDAEGNTRELHIDQSIAVTTYPHVDPALDFKKMELDGATLTQLVSETNFTVYHLTLDGVLKSAQTHPFLMVSILDGEGYLVANGQTFSLKKGDHFLLPATMGDFQVEGHLQAIVSHP